MRRPGWAVSSGLVAIALFVTATASADPRSTVVLRWNAPSSCPSQPEVEREIVRIIGGRTADRDPLAASVEVWPSEAGGWKAEVTLTAAGESTQREVHGGTCRAVANAVAVVVGIAAVQDSRPTLPPAPLPPPSPPSPPPAPFPFPPVLQPLTLPPSSTVTAPSTMTVPSIPTPASTTPSPSLTPSHPSGPRTSRFILGASAIADLGSLPQWTPGVEGVFGWKPSWWQLELAGAYLATQTSDLATIGGLREGVNVWRADILARACAAWGGRRFSAGPCAGANVSWLVGTGTPGVPHPTPAQISNTAGAVLGVRINVHLTSWASLRLGTDLLIPVYGPTFSVTTPTIANPILSRGLYTASAAAIRGTLGLDTIF